MDHSCCCYFTVCWDLAENRHARTDNYRNGSPIGRTWWGGTLHGSGPGPRTLMPCQLCPSSGVAAPCGAITSSARQVSTHQLQQPRRNKGLPGLPGQRVEDTLMFVIESRSAGIVVLLLYNLCRSRRCSDMKFLRPTVDRGGTGTCTILQKLLYVYWCRLLCCCVAGRDR